MGSDLRKRGGAPGRIRTCDTRFRRAVLYPLSYEGGAWLEPSSATGPSHTAASVVETGPSIARGFLRVLLWARGRWSSTGGAVCRSDRRDLDLRLTNKKHAMSGVFAATRWANVAAGRSDIDGDVAAPVRARLYDERLSSIACRHHTVPRLDLPDFSREPDRHRPAARGESDSSRPLGRRLLPLTSPWLATSGPGGRRIRAGAVATRKHVSE